MRKTSDLIWQDAQHQVLFDILDQVQETGPIDQVGRRLREYSEVHFYLEEVYMSRLDYPEMDTHVQAHDSFRQEIGELLTVVDGPDTVHRELIATYLREWLTRHVFGMDRQLAFFILRSGAH